MTLVEPEDRPRRRPSQARSRRRYEAILEAAATLFAESGFDGVTTEAIAAAAGTSIGSLYQFFPGKKAIFVTLAERLMERENALFEEVVAEAQGRPWDELVEAVVDAFADNRAVQRRCGNYVGRTSTDFAQSWTNRKRSAPSRRASRHDFRTGSP